MQFLLRVNTLMFGLVLSVGAFPAYAIDFSAALTQKEHTHTHTQKQIFSKLEGPLATRCSEKSNQN